MKKVFGFLLVSCILWGISTAVFACEEIDFGNRGTICVDLIQDTNTKYSLDVDYSDYDYSTAGSYFYVLLPNKKNKKSSWGGELSSRLSSNNWQFSYDYEDYDGYENSTRPVKIYAIIENRVESVVDYYDFDNGDRSDENWYSSSSSSSNSNTHNGNLDNFLISLSDSSPTEDDEVTLTIKARDNNDYTLSDYDWSNANVKIEYRTSSSNTWYNASSSYASINDTTPNFSNGNATTRITFKYNYEYRIIVSDDDENIEDQKTFDVGNISANYINYDTTNFRVISNNYSPSINRAINLTFKAMDGSSSDTTYEGSVKFKIEYKASSNDSRHTAPSSYYLIKSTYEDGYDFSSSDDGIAILNSFISFKKKYEYKIWAIDKDDANIKWSVIIDLNAMDSNVNWFTEKQLTTVRSFYNARNDTISKVERQFPNLNNNTTRKTMSNTLYNNMKDIVDDKSNKLYNSFDAFRNGYADRLTYTINHQ